MATYCIMYHGVSSQVSKIELLSNATKWSKQEENGGGFLQMILSFTD